MSAEGAFSEALTLLEDRRAQDSTEAETLWRIARDKVNIGEQTASEAEQRSLYAEALEEARGALTADAECANAHLIIAIASGRLALMAGKKERVRRSREVKAHVDRAIEIDPDNDGAYHVRGRWNHEVASLGWVEQAIVKVVYGGLPDASYEQAVEDFKWAIALQDHVVHRLELGRTYLALGQEEKAREQLQRALAMRSVDPDDPAHKEEAQILLDRL